MQQLVSQGGVQAGHPASWLERLFNYKVPRPLVAAYAGGLMLLFIFVAINLPFSLLVDATHDDGLFMTLGRHLAEGDWLGPFSQFTLMKGPGYPAFLALNHWLGTPISLSQALLHCLAVAFFVAVAHRLMRSILLSGILFTLLLWHPIVLCPFLRRILRDCIYFDQLLIALAAFTLLLFADLTFRQRLAAAVFAGLMLGWFWLTREEGVWIFPGFAILVAGALIPAPRHELREKGIALLAVLATCVTVQLGFAAGNWWAYGKFIGVDFKERNFQRALAALDSVRSGGTMPFVSITHAAMQRVSGVSPTFATLAPYFAESSKRWERPGCVEYPETCGEISSGWFMWALRDAAESTGHYASPAEASAFYGRIADEVEAACASGSLECRRQLIGDMPPLKLAWLILGVERYWRKGLALLFTLDPGRGALWSDGDDQSFRQAVRFLNNPVHTNSAYSLRLPRPAPFTGVAISGWYYKSGTEWIDMSMRRGNGQPVEIQFDRLSSPDIAAEFGDRLAASQRFSLKASCDADCVVDLRLPDDTEVSKPLLELLKPGFSVQVPKGTLFIEAADPALPRVNKVSLAGSAAIHIQDWAIWAYKFLYVPALVLGAGACLFTTLRHPLAAWRNPCYVLAATCWVLLFSRFGLLLLIAATSLPGFAPHYMAPAYFMMVSAAIFSCAAWMQLGEMMETRERAQAPRQAALVT